MRSQINASKAVYYGGENCMKIPLEKMKEMEFGTA